MSDTSTAAPSLVHESEAQRQYPRVKLPGLMQMASGDLKAYKLVDVSAGGICFDSAGDAFDKGTSHKGTLMFTISGIGFQIPALFQVRSSNAQTSRVGCQFQDLGARETAALRHLITSFMSGEVVTAGEMLHTLGRENFARPRPDRDAGSLSGTARARALLFSLLAFAVGLAAFLYVAYKVYEIYFVTHAISAKVSGSTVTVAMPRDGVFSALVAEGGTVAKGAPIGSIQSSMLDVVKAPADWATLTPAALQALTAQTVQGTVTSPCDCKVLHLFAAGSQPASRGQVLVDLLPANVAPKIVASFHYRNVDDLSIGRAVTFTLGGDGVRHQGTISALRVPTMANDTLPDEIVATIDPAGAVSVAQVDQPVEVTVSPLSSMGGAQ